jgi:hypothetical protein
MTLTETELYLARRLARFYKQELVSLKNTLTPDSKRVAKFFLAYLSGQLIDIDLPEEIQFINNDREDDGA